MNLESVAAIIFLVLISLFLIIKRKRVKLQKILFPIIYFVMYRTKFGLKSMNSFAKKFKTPLKYFSYFGIFIGFAGIILLTYSLILNIYNLITTPTAVPGVALVLPIKLKGVFYVPFFYWVISIFILAVVHEFSHGIIARLHKIKLKSTGFAFICALIPIQPLAFVEPNEKQIKKLSTAKQLSIFAAGPFSNIMLAFVVLLIFAFLLAPAVSKIIEPSGIDITNIAENSPAEKAGLKKGEIINYVDNKEILFLQNFSDILNKKKPRETITIKTDKKTYTITLGKNPDNETKTYLGIYIQQNTRIKQSAKEKYNFLPNIALWFVGLFYWLYLLNLGIGIFNLIPIGPIDGGRMTFAVLNKLYKKKKAQRISSIISKFFIFLVLINFLAAFI